MSSLTYEQVRDLIHHNNRCPLSVDLLTCLIWLESSFDPNAKSSAHAIGLMQMTKGAVDDVNRNTPAGVHFEHDEMRIPEKNIQCGTHYLHILIERHKDKGVKHALDHYYGTANAGYAEKILACEKCLHQQPDKHKECLHKIHP